MTPNISFTREMFGVIHFEERTQENRPPVSRKRTVPLCPPVSLLILRPNCAGGKADVSTEPSPCVPKCECIYLHKSRIKSPKDVEELTKEFFDYYINFRPQTKLDGLTPAQYRLRYFNSKN